MFPPMRVLAMVWCLLVVWTPLANAVPSPESVAILYNSALPESRQLAEFYRDARGIPAENLIALDMPVTADISRGDYQDLIAAPLRREFDRRAWWKRGRDHNGVTLPLANDIRVLLTMRGVPLRITATPKAAPAPAPAPPSAAPPVPPKDPFTGHDEAAVDSELALFGVEGVPTDGVLQNKYHTSEKNIAAANLPFLVLTARIDAPTYATCEQMIRDAVETEKCGLWGMAYVDIANKFPLGDQWLETVAKASLGAGIPTVIDRFNDTLPKNYPMEGAAMYFGWYDWNVNGPFLNPGFKFRKGAVAVHLHSYSAQQLGDPDKNWSGPLLQRGAAVTIGNVFEPYLHLTHDLGILHQRLLAGHSWVEACWMAMPVASWQGVVLGDPLYQPFRHLGGTGSIRKEDKEFRSLRAAAVQWKDSAAERRTQIDKAARRMNSGILIEALGLELIEQGLTAEAAARFLNARNLYVRTEDKLRQDFHIIAMDRTAERKELALRGLRDARTRYGAIPESESLLAWINILDPPPPPPPPVKTTADKP
ncbi:MAG: TIGR03790 family protein [Luteolibacter sp.]|nr:TIGR03790 family protein [Luteolibacter sp.]